MNNYKMAFDKAIVAVMKHRQKGAIKRLKKKRLCNILWFNNSLNDWLMLILKHKLKDYIGYLYGFHWWESISLIQYDWTLLWACWLWNCLLFLFRFHMFMASSFFSWRATAAAFLMAKIHIFLSCSFLQEKMNLLSELYHSFCLFVHVYTMSGN